MSKHRKPKKSNLFSPYDTQSSGLSLLDELALAIPPQAPPSDWHPPQPVRNEWDDWGQSSTASAHNESRRQTGGLKSRNVENERGLLGSPNAGVLADNVVNPESMDLSLGISSPLFTAQDVDIDFDDSLNNWMGLDFEEPFLESAGETFNTSEPIWTENSRRQPGESLGGVEAQSNVEMPGDVPSVAANQRSSRITDHRAVSNISGAAESVMLTAPQHDASQNIRQSEDQKSQGPEAMQQQWQQMQQQWQHLTMQQWQMQMQMQAMGMMPMPNYMNFQQPFVQPNTPQAHAPSTQEKGPNDHPLSSGSSQSIAKPAMPQTAAEPKREETKSPPAINGAVAQFPMMNQGMMMPALPVPPFVGAAPLPMGIGLAPPMMPFMAINRVGAEPKLPSYVSIASKKDDQQEPSEALKLLLAEEEERRNKRLERNRDSARQSRRRKQTYVENLEMEIKNLHVDKTTLIEHRWGTPEVPPHVQEALTGQNRQEITDAAVFASTSRLRNRLSRPEGDRLGELSHSFTNIGKRVMDLHSGILDAGLLLVATKSAPDIAISNLSRSMQLTEAQKQQIGALSGLCVAEAQKVALLTKAFNATQRRSLGSAAVAYDLHNYLGTLMQPSEVEKLMLAAETSTFFQNMDGENLAKHLADDF